MVSDYPVFARNFFQSTVFPHPQPRHLPTLSFVGVAFLRAESAGCVTTFGVPLRRRNRKCVVVSKSEPFVRSLPYQMADKAVSVPPLRRLCQRSPSSSHLWIAPLSLFYGSIGWLSRPNWQPLFCEKRPLVALLPPEESSAWDLFFAGDNANGLLFGEIWRSRGSRHETWCFAAIITSTSCPINSEFHCTFAFFANCSRSGTKVRMVVVMAS